MTVVARASSVKRTPRIRRNIPGRWNRKNVGFIKSLDGGSISAEMINEPAGSNDFAKKHLGQPKYEEFTSSCRQTGGAHRKRSGAKQQIPRTQGVLARTAK
jgi:hypothetical protein